MYFKDDCGSTPSIVKKTLAEDLKDDSSDGFTGVFDTNAITPGTEFMIRLDCFIQELISFKISSDEKWKNLNVIFSGFRIPGEGEQKIMEYIRKHQNKKHNAIIYSPDADLIFFISMLTFTYQKIKWKLLGENNAVEIQLYYTIKIYIIFRVSN